MHTNSFFFRSLSGAAEDRNKLLEDETEGNQRILSTMKGVFAPVSLSMFSALLFLRIGYIVGNAGYLETVLQFTIAYVILVSTVFSICAIATNGAVKVTSLLSLSLYLSIYLSLSLSLSLLLSLSLSLFLSLLLLINYLLFC